MCELHIDYETASKLDVTKVGASKYSLHPSTRVLMVAYAFDDGPIKQWVPAEGQPIPFDLEYGLRDDFTTKFAWNASFEVAITHNVLGIMTDVKAWKDVMVMAYYASLPGKLAHAGPVLRLPESMLKQTGGTQLINLFSTRKKHWTEEPVKWEKFKSYNRADLRAEREIHRRLRPFDLPDYEWDAWWLDQEMNRRGIPVNISRCVNVVRVRDQFMAEYFADMKERTGLENPNSGKQLLPWLKERGYTFNDLKAGHVKTMLEEAEDLLENWGGGADDPLRELIPVLRLRQFTSRTSTTKYDRILAHVDHDSVIRNCLQFMGAPRTHRWGGRVFQPHNLKTPVPGLDGLDFKEVQPDVPLLMATSQQIQAALTLGTGDIEEIRGEFDNPIEAMASTVRPTIEAPDGYLFVVFDFSAVENVTIGWLADDRLILKVFEDGMDPYLHFATYMYGKSYAELEAEFKAGEKQKRKICKPPVLGCGFGLGKGMWKEDKDTGEAIATGLLGYAQSMGVDLSLEQSEMMVETWRDTYTGVSEGLWPEIESAAFRAVRTGKEQCLDRISFDYKKPFLRMNLPKGGYLHYLRPKLVNQMKPWGKRKWTLTYEGQRENRSWGRLSTHPGKITENAVQKIARDLLREALTAIDFLEWDIRMHVHDEVLVLVREDQAIEAFQEIKECMVAPRWAPGMPVKAAGYISKWFVKD